MGSIFSTERTTKKHNLKSMIERKKCLLETSSILFGNQGQQQEFLKNIKDEQIKDLLDISKEYEKLDTIITTHATASFAQMYPVGLIGQLRDPEIKPKSMKNCKPGSFNYASFEDFIPDQNVFLFCFEQDYSGHKYIKLNYSEAIKYFLPNTKYKTLSTTNVPNMSFQTSNYLTLNGLKFYPTSIVSEEPGKEIIRFKSDGLVVVDKNDQLIDQLKSALVENEKAADELYQNEEAELTECGVLFGERRVIEKQLKIEMNKKLDKQIYLNLSIPVGWSCVAHCYWVHLSIIQQS